MKTTILIPTYNESGNIEPLIGRIFEFMPDASILVIDDNSPDGTGIIVEKVARTDPRVRLLSRTKKEGLGKAYLAGFTEVLQDPSIDFLIMMDADFSHDPSYIPVMLRATANADVVIGSRYCRGGGTKGWAAWRRFLSGFANRYCRLITGMPINDATAGFNLIRADILRDADTVQLNLSGYAFQMELKYLLWKHKARFAEVPITFYERREGESKISNHIILEGIIAPWKMRFKTNKR